MSTTEIVTPQLQPGRLFINGRWEDSDGGRTIDICNPAIGECLTTVPDADPQDVDRAVKAARDSFEKKSWRGMDPSKKEKLLWNVAELLHKYREELALLESLENGKMVREAAGADVSPAIDSFRYYAGGVRKIYGETIPVDGPFLNYTLREPIGVVSAIVPWNYPLQLAVWKRDIKLAHRLAADIKAGSVWIDTYKQSGFGRDSGSYAPDQYTNVKSVWVAL